MFKNSLKKIFKKIEFVLAIRADRPIVTAPVPCGAVQACRAFATLEMIVYPNERKRSMGAPVASLPDICRVDSIKVLGVIIQNNLSMKLHVSAVCQSTAQSLYALKVLKAHGLDKQTMFFVCRATVASRLTYAVPAWWGVCLCRR
jgi:hypothetical protein